MRLRVLLMTAAALMLAMAACTVTTHSTSCKNNRCTVSFSGEQTLELGTGEVKRKLVVEKIESDAVTVSVLSDRARLTPGQTDTVGSMTVQAVSIDGRTVKLDVTLN